MKDLFKIVAIIPARGGSKSIPKKNIKLFAGKPLIAWTIENSLDSKLVNRTIVSTDDQEIVSVSKEYGAEVIVRPSEFAQDFSTSEDVLLHVMGYLKERENYEPDIIVMLQCTSPLRGSEHIDGAIRRMLEKGSDSLMSTHKIYDTFWMADGLSLRPITYDLNNHQSRFRQNVKPIIVENGAIYITKANLLKKYRNRLCGRIETYEMPSHLALEIDSEFDFWLNEKIILDWLKNEKR